MWRREHQLGRRHRDHVRDHRIAEYATAHVRIRWAYTIVARGMGNCDGQATTKVQVNGPAPPPSPSAEIAAVKFSPMPAVARERTTISVEGRGTCSFSADYGDGNIESFSDELPRRVTHTYGAPDTYTVVIRPTPPCTGKFTQKLTVSPRNPTMITDMRLGPSPAGVRQPVTITVGGNGTCSYTIDYGDGNTEDRAKPLPDTLQHVYQRLIPHCRGNWLGGLRRDPYGACSPCNSQRASWCRSTSRRTATSRLCGTTIGKYAQDDQGQPAHGHRGVDQRSVGDQPAARPVGTLPGAIDVLWALVGGQALGP